MRITYYGHSCCGIEIDGKHVLIDPFITPNALASHIDPASVQADYIVCTHGHQDHVADVIAVYENTKAKLISNYEIVEWFTKQGLENGVGMNTGGSYKEDPLSFKCFQALHSSTLPDGSNGGNPNGYIIHGTSQSVYHAGDTGLMLDMQLLKDMHLNVALLPIGDHFTMGVDDAIKAAGFIGCSKVIGIHYDTFPPISIDKEEAKNKFSASGIELILMDIGETIEIQNTSNS